MTPTAELHPGGWYAIDGHDSYHGSDDPRYLRALLLTGSANDGPRIRAVLAAVERDTPAVVRWFRDWRWSR